MGVFQKKNIFENRITFIQIIKQQRIMGILSWIILGLLAGAIAKWIRPGKDPGGCIVTILIGIAGAFLGGWIGSMLGLGTVDTFNIRTLLLAILGSVIVLWLYAMVRGRR